MHKTDADTLQQIGWLRGWTKLF